MHVRMNPCSVVVAFVAACVAGCFENSSVPKEAVAVEGAPEQEKKVAAVQASLDELRNDRKATEDKLRRVEEELRVEREKRMVLAEKINKAEARPTIALRPEIRVQPKVEFSLPPTKRQADIILRSVQVSATKRQRLGRLRSSRFEGSDQRERSGFTVIGYENTAGHNVCHV